MDGEKLERWIHELWNHKWVEWLLFAGFALCAVYFLCSLPSPGISVCVLGGAAAIMSSRDSKTLAKMGWTAVIFLLMFVEIRSVRNEAAKQNTVSSKIAADFEKIGQGLEQTVLSFKTVNAKLDDLRRDPSRLQALSTEDSRRENIAQASATLNRISSDVSNNPKKYLAAVSIKIENALRLLLARSGQARFIVNDPTANATSLAHFGYIPKDLEDATRSFFELKSRCVNTMATSQAEYEMAGKAGSLLFQRLSAVPMSTVRVIDSDLPIYADETGTQQLDGVGVLVETTEPDGKKHENVYPTTKIGYFKKGMDVSWEWLLEPVWRSIYYRDPTTGKLKYAGAAANFNGRDIKELEVTRR